MNQTADLWISPWHARLKNLSETVRLEATVTAVATSNIARVRTALRPAGSWLGRARSRTFRADLSCR